MGFLHNKVTEGGNQEFSSWKLVHLIRRTGSCPQDPLQGQNRTKEPGDLHERNPCRGLAIRKPWSWRHLQDCQRQGKVPCYARLLPLPHQLRRRGQPVAEVLRDGRPPQCALCLCLKGSRT